MDDTTKRMAEGIHRALEAEIDGYHFYMMAAKTTSDGRGREVFERLAQDELLHARFLKSQYAALMDSGKTDPTAKLGAATAYDGDHPIFSSNLKARVKDAHFEMSALSIGAQLELSAIQFYKGEAEAATDPAVKQFFTELAAWEKGHYDALNRQHETLKEDYWSGGGFSPF